MEHRVVGPEARWRRSCYFVAFEDSFLIRTCTGGALPRSLSVGRLSKVGGGGGRVCCQIFYFSYSADYCCSDSGIGHCLCKQPTR